MHTNHLIIKQEDSHFASPGYQYMRSPLSTKTNIS